MFGSELKEMVGLLKNVLGELKKSNESQKQLLAAVEANNKYTKSLLIRLQAQGASSKETADAPTEGNFYRGGGGSSHKGNCKTEGSDSADCRSKCNGKCDDADEEDDDDDGSCVTCG